MFVGVPVVRADYDRDGFLDLFVCNYVELDLKMSQRQGRRLLPVERHSRYVRSSRTYQAGLNILYHNNGDGTFADVSEKAGILKPGPRYSITAVVL